MFAIPFGRIFWKEYRVHRALWFSCLAIGCLMQLLMWCFFVRSPNQTVQEVYVFVVIIPLMYAIGCGALLFAGEREDRTSEWLVALAAPPAPTLFAKLAFGICSTVALQLAMEILSRFVLVGAPDSNGPSRFVVPMPYGPLMLAWTILGSLRSRQVMKSFLAMLLFVFLTSACIPVLILGFSYFFRNPQDLLVIIFAFVTIFFVVVVADLGLGWRWCEGKYFDGATLGAFFERNDRLDGEVPGKTTTINRVPVRTEYEQPWRRTWQRLVWQERHRSSMASVLIISCLAGAVIGSIRTESGLINHEGILGLISIVAFSIGLAGFRSDSQFQQPRFLVARGTSPAAVWLSKHFVWFTRACWFAVVTLVASIGSYVLGDYREVVLMMTLIPILFVLGLRFLSKIRLPEMISSQMNSGSFSWLNKQVELTSRALWILGIVYLLSNWFDWMSRGQSDPRSWRFHATAALMMIVLGIRFDSNLILPGISASDHSSRFWNQLPNLAKSLPKLLSVLGGCWLAFVAIADLGSPIGISPRASIRLSTGMNFDWEILFWCVVLSYCCGQLAAILFQRVTLSLVFGLGFTGGSLLWLALMHLMAIPKWWSVGLVVLAMLGLTLWQLKPWLLENRSWSRRWRLASALVAIPALLVMLLAYYRVAEANLPLAIDQTLGHHFHSPNSKQAPVADSESGRLRLETLSHLESGSQVAIEQVAIEEIIDLLNRDSALFMSAKSEDDQTFVMASRIRNLLSHQAQVLLQGEISQADSLKKALECHLASLQLARIVSRGPFFAWLNGFQIQSATLENLVQWANHSLQTPASIRAGIKLVESELKQFPSATTGIADSYWAERRRWILSSRSEVMEELSGLSSRERDSIGLQMLPIVLPWERERADLLMARDAQIQLAAVWSLEQRLNSPNGSARRTVEKEFGSIVAANEKLTRTTPLLKFTRMPPLDMVIASILRCETTTRAAITRMELIAYRLEHGKLPDRLVQLMETLDGKYLIDPWSDRLFDFYPSFLLSAGNSHNTLVPVSPTEVEILHDSISKTSGRVNVQDILTETRPAEVIHPDGTTSMDLNRDGVTIWCLFKIPPSAIH